MRLLLPAILLGFCACFVPRPPPRARRRLGGVRAFAEPPEESLFPTTVAALKAELKERGGKRTGNKAALAARLAALRDTAAPGDAVEQVEVEEVVDPEEAQANADAAADEEVDELRFASEAMADAASAGAAASQRGVLDGLRRDEGARWDGSEAGSGDAGAAYVSRARRCCCYQYYYAPATTTTLPPTPSLFQLALGTWWARRARSTQSPRASRARTWCCC